MKVVLKLSSIVNEETFQARLGFATLESCDLDHRGIRANLNKSQPFITRHC